MSTAKTSRAAAGAALEWDWPRVVSIVVAIFGLCVAGYMTWAEATGNETVCAETGAIDCSVVQESAYADTLGIPVALMGMAGYMAMLVVFALEDQIDIVATYGRTWIVAMTLFGVMFQLYLTYVEAAVLEKWCQWCIMSFVAITILFVIGMFRLNRFIRPLRA